MDSSPDEPHETAEVAHSVGTRDRPRSAAHTGLAVMAHRHVRSAARRQGRGRRHSARRVHDDAPASEVNLWPPEQQQQQQRGVDDLTISHVPGSTAPSTSAVANATPPPSSVVVQRLHGLRRRLTATRHVPQRQPRYLDARLVHSAHNAVLYGVTSAQHVERNVGKTDDAPSPPPSSRTASASTPLGSPLIASRASSLMQLPSLLVSPQSESARAENARQEDRASGRGSRRGGRSTSKATASSSYARQGKAKRSRSRQGGPLALLRGALHRPASCLTRHTRAEAARRSAAGLDGAACGAPAVSCTTAGVTSRQRCILHIVDALHLPQSLQSAVFETLFFFTRVRVYVVLLFVLLAVLLVTQRSVLDDVASTFVVMDENRPGLTFLQRYNQGNRTLPHKHPVVIVPGFITNALEVWEGDLPCMREQSFLAGSFRQRMQGPQMMYLSVRNTQCWLDLFSLDRDTGLDRPGVRVRADMGFTSVDYVIPGYWVWAKVLVNFADIGYDPQSMAVVTFDWRLSPTKMHERDGFFYSMRNSIKFLTQKNRERAIVLSHSYGATIALAFFKWADEREPGFMDTYVAYYVNVGGVGLGLPKSLATMLLGDMRDTISIPRPMRTILDSFMNQTARYNAMRTWSCFVAMLPGGCEDIFPHLLTLANGTTLGPRAVRALVRDECVRSGHRSCVAEMDRYERAKTQLPSLPRAPNTTVVCLYGVNKPTETGYVLAHSAEDRLLANLSYFDNETVQGVRLGDGDGTVPLLSLGYMCRAANGWRRDVGRVVTVEYRHDSDTVPALNLRGGTASGGHVDILGNSDFLETLLKIASGMDELAVTAGDETRYYDPATGKSHLLHRRVQDRIYSDIDVRIATKLQSCLLTEKEPIAPKATAESNPFVCRNDTRRTHLDEK